MLHCRSHVLFLTNHMTTCTNSHWMQCIVGSTRYLLFCLVNLHEFVAVFSSTSCWLKIVLASDPENKQTKNTPFFIRHFMLLLWHIFSSFIIIVIGPIIYFFYGWPLWLHAVSYIPSSTHAQHTDEHTTICRSWKLQIDESLSLWSLKTVKTCHFGPLPGDTFEQDMSLHQNHCIGS